MDGTVLGGEGDEVSIMSVVYPHTIVRVSTLRYFLSVGSSSEPSFPSLIFSFRELHNQDHFN